MNYGLIGAQLGHSFSKVIHEQLAKYTYELHPLQPEMLPAFMEERAFTAINVTIPYKQAVIPYCTLDDKATKIGAVNTIVNRDGVLYATNTDYDGFRYTLHKHKIAVFGKKVVILGDGGAAQAIKAVLQDEGASTLISVRRHPSATTYTYEEAVAQHNDATILINTSPSGMYPNLEDTPGNLDDFPACEAVVDIIYNPLRTSLCLQAKAKKIPYAGGLEMLVAQAKYAVEFFLGTTIDDQQIDALYRTIFQEKSNIVLIGMPSCGKSTLGKALAHHLGKTFVDLDTCVEQNTNRTIRDIILQDGEHAFRALETQAVKDVSSQNNLVIATGGGVVKKERNRTLLQMNGIVLYIQRDLDALLVDDARPLSSSKKAIQTLYEERKSLYESMSDAIIENNAAMEDALAASLAAITYA